MATKPCKECGVVKRLSEFYAHAKMSGGRVNICKECNKKKVRANRLSNLDYYRWYDQQRNASPERIRARAARAKRNKANTAAIRAKSSARYPERKRARAILAAAVKAGKVRRGPCRDCGSSNSEGHHPDYSKPLDVIWLCPKHHAIEDKRKIQRESFMFTPKRKLMSAGLNPVAP